MLLPAGHFPPLYTAGHLQNKFLYLYRLISPGCLNYFSSSSHIVTQIPQRSLIYHPLNHAFIPLMLHLRSTHTTFTATHHHLYHFIRLRPSNVRLTISMHYVHVPRSHARVLCNAMWNISRHGGFIDERPGCKCSHRWGTIGMPHEKGGGLSIAHSNGKHKAVKA